MMPQVGKWTDETHDKPLTPQQRAALEKLQAELKAQQQAAQHVSAYTAPGCGCGTGLLILRALCIVAGCWWAIAQLCALRG